MKKFSVKLFLTNGDYERVLVYAHNPQQAKQIVIDYFKKSSNPVEQVFEVVMEIGELKIK